MAGPATQPHRLRPNPAGPPRTASSAWPLAWAMLTELKVLLADEPTGDLDGNTAEAVFELIHGLNRGAWVE